MKKTSLMVVLLVSLMVLLLASCGTKKDAPEEPKDAAESEEEAAEEEAEEAEEEAEPKEDYQKWFDDWNAKVESATKMRRQDTYKYAYLDGHEDEQSMEYLYDVENSLYARGANMYSLDENGEIFNERYEYRYYKVEDGTYYEYFPLDDSRGEEFEYIGSFLNPGLFTLYKDANKVYDLQYEELEQVEEDGRTLIPIHVSGNMTVKLEEYGEEFTKEEAEQYYVGENRDVEGYDEAVQKLVDAFNVARGALEATNPVSQTVYFDAETHDVVRCEVPYEYDEDGEQKSLNFEGDAAAEKAILVAMRELAALTGLGDSEPDPKYITTSGMNIQKVTLNDEVEIPME